MKLALLACVVVLVSCGGNQPAAVKAIVGAKLIAAPGRAPIEYSVIIVEGGKFQAVGPQSSTPVPKGSEITSGLGFTAEPAPGGTPIEPGQPADLVLHGTTERVMRAGEWISK
jgi:hypothetical protein